jgi:hypothetical protein
MRSLSCLGVWRERREGGVSVIALKTPGQRVNPLGKSAPLWKVEAG